jgi:metacaspase-1
MHSRAVLIGIDYLTTAYPLKGCSTDVRNMAKFLTEELHYADVQIYTEQTTPQAVTTHGLLNLLWQLVITSHTERLERLWIHFSGHGAGITDRSGDEVDGQDEAICPLDYATHGVIRDDVLKQMFRHFNPGTQVTLVFDCCHSGTIGDLQYELSLAEGALTTKDNKGLACPANITLLAGCSDQGKALDVYNINNQQQYSGAMTSALLSCMLFRKQLTGTIAARKIIRDLHRMLQRKGIDQRPVLTTSRPIDTLTSLC